MSCSIIGANRYLWCISRGSVVQLQSLTLRKMRLVIVEMALGRRGQSTFRWGISMLRPPPGPCAHSVAASLLIILLCKHTGRCTQFQLVSTSAHWDTVLSICARHVIVTTLRCKQGAAEALGPTCPQHQAECEQRVRCRLAILSSHALHLLVLPLHHPLCAGTCSSAGPSASLLSDATLRSAGATCVRVHAPLARMTAHGKPIAMRG